MSGGELFEKISQSNFKMTEYEAKRYIRQLCEGLKHMHENSIVHLNIKPENIMFETKAAPSTSSNLKLVDFSLLK
jgi:serine/threonine protein kinase